MARGVVSLYGVKSELFVAMNDRGRLYGTVGVRNRVIFLSACQCNAASIVRFLNLFVTHAFGK